MANIDIGNSREKERHFFSGTIKFFCNHSCSLLTTKSHPDADLRPCNMSETDFFVTMTNG